MSKHKSEDLKISAVEYYIESYTSFAETCRIFKCSERSLKRWIERYNNEKIYKKT
jgi:transposase-like protein